MFKKILIIPFLAAAAAGCSGLPADRETVTLAFSEQPVMRPDFEFVKVPASAFTFNETPSGRLIDGASQGTEVIQESFWISREPVTEKHFQYYMNGRKFPENGLSFDDAEKLFDNIFRQTGYPVMLPTESQLEAAFNAGVLGTSKTDEYLARDMWTTAGLPEDSRPWWASSDERQHDVSKDIVLRTLYERQATEPFRRRRANKIHMVLACDEPTDTLSYLLDLMDYGSELYCEPSDGKRESVTACGTTFEMLPVQGGKALLGATREQQSYADEDESPVREATIRDFKLGRTEVTIGQWNAVMGSLPYGNDPRYPSMAVCNVSYYDATEFILKLREVTGRAFRLPTEDEWEYAARGGRRSHGYVFSGSGNSAEVAVCATKNRKGESVYHRSVNAGSLKANELGFQDMSGNMWEWTRTAHPDGGVVQKGGSYKSLNTACRVSNRQPMQPENKKETFGFRIAL